MVWKNAPVALLIKNISKRGGGLNFQDWHDYPVGEQLLFRERWDELLTLLGKNHAHIGVSLLFTELGRLRMGYDQARTAIEIVQKIKQYCGEDFPVILRFSLKSYIKDLRQGAVPGETFTELGRDTDEGLQAARILVDAGYDALGDGRRVRNIFGAIWDGYEAARSL